MEEFLTLPKLAKKYGLSDPTALKEAKKAGALYNFGNAYRINVEQFNSYIESKKVEGEAK